MNNIAYTKEARIRMIEDVLLPLGYEKTDKNYETSWFKYYDEDSNYSPVMVIDIYLGAELEFNYIHLTSQLDEYDYDPDEDDIDEVGDFINLVKKANEQVINDLHKVQKYIEDTILNDRLLPDELIEEKELQTRMYGTTKLTLKECTSKGNVYYEIDVLTDGSDQVNGKPLLYSVGHYKTLEEAKAKFNRE